MTKNIITRFAPSPTGMLHIGSARTALFNYLFAKYLLRVEDTDKKRSTELAKNVIIEGLNWLGLDYDDEIIFQSKRKKRHQEVVKELLANGNAYYCYSSKEELAKLREEAQKNNHRFKYDRRWRNKDPESAPKNVKPVVRIKAPMEGNTLFNDLVQGNITIPNDDLDDFIIQRDDGTPTYMLAVVIDDYDMNISHIIRGDDHLSNVAKQIVIYNAMGWDIPAFAHIPLIYGEDGKKLSKRHGATAVTEFKDLGYMAVAMRNYLLRLGFSHGDDEIISDEEAIKWFNIDNIGKSPARFDYKKLDSLNAHYFHLTDNKVILSSLQNQFKRDFTQKELDRLNKLLDEIKVRSKNIFELNYNIQFLLEEFDFNNLLTEKAQKIIKENISIKIELINLLSKINDFSHNVLYEKTKSYTEKHDYKMKNVAALLRAALTASHISPSIFEIMAVLGKEETIKRLDYLKT